MTSDIFISYIPAPEFEGTGPDWIVKNRLRAFITDIPGIQQAFVDPSYPETVGVVWRSQPNSVRGREVTHVSVQSVPSTYLDDLKSWTYEEIFGRPQPAPLTEYSAPAPPMEYNSELRFDSYRNIPNNSTNAITFNDIKNGNLMVNFHNRYSHGNYFKKSTYNSLPVNENTGLRRNPITRQPIEDENLQPYKARIVGGYRKKTRTRRRMKRRKSITRRQLAQRRSDRVTHNHGR